MNDNNIIMFMLSFFIYKNYFCLNIQPDFHLNVEKIGKIVSIVF